MPKKITDELRAKILSTKGTITKIARTFKVSDATVSRVRAQAKAPATPTPHNERRTTDRRTSAPTVAEYLIVDKNGQLVQEVAAAAGLTAKAVALEALARRAGEGVRLFRAVPVKWRAEVL